MIDVLIVDDDFMVAKIHQSFVERIDGFQVVGMAHTGNDALAETERLQPDLVLLDVYLPDTSGLELLQQLRDVAPELDVLVISAAREIETVRRALRGGIVQYLMKPFTFEDFRDRLEHYQQTYAALDQAEEQPDQADVDRIFGISGKETPLPKGLSGETLRVVAEALRDAPHDLSAAETAAILGLARVSARRYLEHLVDSNRAEVTLRYGEVGRPERRYAWKSRP